MSFPIDALSEYSYQTLRPFKYNRNYVSSTQTDILGVKKIDSYTVQNNVSKKQYALVSDEQLNKPRILSLPDDEQLKEMDLNKGYDPDIDWISLSASKLECFLVAIKNSKIDPFKHDFVGLRGIFKTVMFSPFVVYPWRIGACKFKNTIFFCSYRQRTPDPRDPIESDKQAYRLIKFFEHATVPGWHHDENNLKEKPSSTKQDRIEKSDVSLQSINSEDTDSACGNSTENDELAEKSEDGKEDMYTTEYVPIIQARVRSRGRRDFNLLYAGVVEAIKDSECDDKLLSNFVTMKMLSDDSSSKRVITYERFKLPKWYILNVLSGVPKTIVGKYDKESNITSFEEVLTASIPTKCSGHWRDNQSVDHMSSDHLYRFLSHVQSAMKNETNPNIIYFFERKKYDVETYKLAEEFHESSILPAWFLDEYEDYEEDSFLSGSDDRFW